VAPRACVRVYARVLVPPNLYIHTYIHTRLTLLTGSQECERETHVCGHIPEPLAWRRWRGPVRACAGAAIYIYMYKRHDRVRPDNYNIGLFQWFNPEHGLASLLFGGEQR